MNELQRRCAAAVVVVALLGAAGALAGSLTIVTVTGNGITSDAALKDALRKALEKGAGLEIASFSKVENFELVRDTIFSRSDGLVSEYTVLDEGEGANNVYYCKIRAQVSKSAIARAWGEVQHVLSLIGRPKVMVYITEKIDHELDDNSILESKIEERLIKSGFDVYDSSQLNAIAAKEAAYAVETGNKEKMRALAKGFGTQIFVMGHANANKAENTSPHGVNLVMYNCDVQAKVFYTDTGKLLASESLPVTRGGARGYTTFSRQAGKMAIFNAAAPLIDNVYNTVMKSWATQISFGSEIRIDVEGFGNAAEAFKLRKRFKAIRGVEAVNGPKYTEGTGVYRIRAIFTAEDMMEYLAQDDWSSVLEVFDVSLNRIQAKWIGR